MAILKGQESRVECDGRSAIVSHQKSFSNKVHAICHHSGRYLTVSETNPTARLLLREQHDFPGLPKLDDAFKKAAHSQQHEHWVWSHPGIQGMTFVVSSMIILYLAYRINQLTDFVAGGIWLILYWAILGISIGVGLFLSAYGAYLILQRNTIFHKRARGLPPVTSDFPVECTYEIEMTETVEAELGNGAIFPHIVKSHNGRISVTLNPMQNEWETLDEYRAQYQNHRTGEIAVAGAVAMEGITGIVFLNDNVDFGHRLVLQTPTANLEIDQETDIYKPFTVTTEYNVTPEEIFPEDHGLLVFPLQCEPRLSHDNSRLLELQFTWLGPKPVPKLVLEECILGAEEAPIPQSLLPVTRVEYGRYDASLEAERIIWRNLAFRADHQGIPQLSLFASFEHPLLDCQTAVTGTYRVRLNGLVSQLEISNQHIWTAWGLKAESDSSLIRKKSTIYGDVVINPQLLSQEHEHVTNALPIICQVPPNKETVTKIMNVLLDEGFDLQRIVQAPFRLHPTGRLDAQLRYWDISGRHYDHDTLEAIDMHVVISGYEHVSRVSSKGAISPQTQVDLRLRCLHDPRNPLTAEHADTLLGQDITPKNGTEPSSKTALFSFLPHRLYGRLRNVLLNTGAFTYSREMQAIFTDSRISPWQAQLPQLESPADRVEAIIQLLYPAQHQEENGLVLLLEVLKDRTDEANMEYRHLDELKQQLKALQNSLSRGQNASHTARDHPIRLEMTGLVARIKQTLAEYEPME